MYLIENRVFYTSAKFDLNENIIKDNESIFSEHFPNVSISFSKYCFDRFNTNNVYVQFSFDKNNEIFFQKYFSQELSVDKFIEKIIIKTHPNGITSSEIFFKFAELKIEKFDNYLDDFSNIYTSTLSEIIYEINTKLELLGLMNFPNHYKYGVLFYEEKNFFDIFSNFYNKEVKQSNFVELMKESYLLRIHLVLENDTDYIKIKELYNNDDIKSIECFTKIYDSKIKATLYWAFVLHQVDKIDLEVLSKLMDIDSYTMNEIVIYNVAGYTYTDLMYSINFNLNSNLKSNDLFEMYKINSFFLQKNKLSELSFNEDVNNFVTYQREIEKFQMQQATYENSEQKFLEVYNAVETNEKSKANRIIQYILTALTLLTIISVSKDIVEFVKAEFLDENTNLKIDLLSRSEFLIFLLVSIIFLFLKLRQYINKI